METGKAIFPRMSFDLIYARVRPDARRRGARSWSEAMKLATEHVSLYQLTIEPDTIFERLWRAGKLAMPDDELGRALFDATQEITGAHGMPAYEISNHARPGAECRHNLVYWRYGEYVGVGPGAHGRIGLGRAAARAGDREAPGNVARPGRDRGPRADDDDPLTQEEQSDEYLLMGLRLREGIDIQRYEAISGRALAPQPDRVARRRRLRHRGRAGASW